MANKNPSPHEILAALKNHNVDVKTVKGWDYRGREWQGPDGSEGLLGMVCHHTSTPTATGSHGAPTLGWATYPFGEDDYSCCQMLVGRGPGDTYLIQAGSGYHSGLGGPAPGIGDNYHGFGGQYRLFGVEIDDPGLEIGSFTDYQIQQVAKIGAALKDLCGWPDDMPGVMTHGCYTNGCHGVNPDGPSPSVGRKNDTLEGDLVKSWPPYPGSNKAVPYNRHWWIEQMKNASNKVWDGTVPSRKAVMAVYDGGANKAAWRLRAKLADLGFTNPKKVPHHKHSVYPHKAMERFREAQGWRGGEGHDGFSRLAQQRIFGTTKD